MKYIRNYKLNLMDVVHQYKSYGWTTSVCCTSYLRMYFTRIQLTDLLHPYVKNTRSTRTLVTQKSQKMCTSAEIKPTPVILSPPWNHYLSQQCKTTTERNCTTMKKPSLKHRKPQQYWCHFKEKQRGKFLPFFKYVGCTNNSVGCT